MAPYRWRTLSEKEAREFLASRRDVKVIYDGRGRKCSCVESTKKCSCVESTKEAPGKCKRKK